MCVINYGYKFFIQIFFSRKQKTTNNNNKCQQFHGTVPWVGGNMDCLVKKKKLYKKDGGHGPNM